MKINFEIQRVQLENKHDRVLAVNHITGNTQVCVPLPTYADNVALPTIARRCCCQSMGQSYGQPDGHPTVTWTQLRTLYWQRQ